MSKEDEEKLKNSESEEETHEDSKLEEIVEGDKTREIAEEISKKESVPEKINKTPEFDSNEFLTLISQKDSFSPVLEQAITIQENINLEKVAETSPKSENDSKVDYDSNPYDVNKYSGENKYENENRTQEFEIRGGVGKDLGLQPLEKNSRDNYTPKNRENSENFDSQKYHSRKFK